MAASLLQPSSPLQHISLAEYAPIVRLGQILFQFWLRETNEILFYFYFLKKSYFITKSKRAIIAIAPSGIIKYTHGG